jgi:glycosyltransferase involved in cell wall biosynthesis
MKVGIDISSVIYGTGVSNYTQELVDHLAPLVDLKTFQFSRYPLMVMEYIWNRLHVLNVETFTGDIDIYHSSDWTQAPARAKKVTTVHDLTPFLYPTEVDPLVVEVHTRRMKWVEKECDAVICVSQSTASDLKKLFKIPDEKIHVIYEGLPTKFAIKPNQKMSDKYIFAIGANQPRKNILRLEKVCQKLGLKLLTAGHHGNLGYVSDQELVNYLASAQAFVYPSIYEGFGLPILEAFYHQVPVACSNTSSMPEVGGEAAVYFDPLNEEDMAKAITNAIKNKNKLVGLGNKQLTKFSWDKCAQETLAVYKSIL